ncbi:hypothetical protein GETHLI_28100 [Geothrix limicola]|uniref:ABC transporter permease n=1 Tax=Geothrix limicola TaxID=2927978 RepID=A0ABQ5QJ06_9BACT|nr:hypothetical protein [Geothrix limicola]GLH74308.1 hypothetical protein GETHLI_28100 [Geothrix limicola]
MPEDPSRPMSAAPLSPSAREAAYALGNRALHWWILVIVAALLWVLLS